MKNWVTIGALAVLLAGAVGMAFATWGRLGDAPISAGGFVALGFGVVFTLLLGGGLMFLVFYSNRKGYDDTER